MLMPLTAIRCSIKEVVLKNFEIFTEKHLCWSLSFGVNFIKKILQHKRFPVNIAKFLRTPIFTNNCGPEYTYFLKPGQIVRQKRCYVGQSKLQTGHQAKLFLNEIMTSRIYVALKTIWNFCTLINIKLR